MIEVRIHGRGGQGTVLISLIIAHAVHRHGYHVQVFPEFGVERRGVPVTAFARIDDKPIRLRTKITQPHHVLILDPALPQYLPVTAGLREGGWIVINAERPQMIRLQANGWKIAWVDATDIAARHGIGTKTSPIVNTTMFGAFARVTGLCEEGDFLPAISSVLSEGARNAAAALEAYQNLQVLPTEIESAFEHYYGRI